MWLRRSVPEIANPLVNTTTGGETPARPSIYNGTGSTAGQTATSAHEGFVALLHAQPSGSLTALDVAESVDSNGNLVNGGTTGTYGVERVNYDASMNGGVHVYALGGNDYFSAADHAAPTYLDGGSGDNSFQIGQLYGMPPTGGPQ